jgi:hypothetical protein
MMRAGSTGMPLASSTVTQASMTLIARSRCVEVRKEPVDPSVILVPAGYTRACSGEMESGSPIRTCTNMKIYSASQTRRIDEWIKMSGKRCRMNSRAAGYVEEWRRSEP